MKNLFQALKNSNYPTVPATWPNRAVRRAVRKGHTSRLPDNWRVFLDLNKDFRAAILQSRLA